MENNTITLRFSELLGKEAMHSSLENYRFSGPRIPQIIENLDYLEKYKMLMIIILHNLESSCITQLKFILLFYILLTRLIVLINSESYLIPLKRNLGISRLYYISLPSCLIWMSLSTGWKHTGILVFSSYIQWLRNSLSNELIQALR